ncbi:MAG: NADH-quinone oxidoreductase subunit M [bacterium ADurb.Bin429]|nr:MAG: NADH-quinone oxidoreductase subunit M [bacterium ADurb.Bin429]
MILVLLIVNLLIGGGLAWLASRWSASAARWTALVVTLFELIFVLLIWLRLYPAKDGPWLAGTVADWIPNFGVKFILLMDGLGLLLITLTAVLGVLAVLVSWREIQENVGFYYLNLLFVLAGIIGVFVALDLVLFYFFWELMLIPMFLLIANWGHEHRKAAAIKFFLFTQLSSLLMLVAIIGLALVHFQQTGAITFDYRALLGTAPGSLWLMLGFFIAFAVKLPAFPVHTWLPDAHTEAPTAGSLILAGLLLKTGAYGLIRFILPLFPDASAAFAPIAMTLGVIGIIYGAILAFAQTDFKRMVAYTSVSHLGFVLLAVFAMNLLALQGAVVQMIAHGFSTGALFVLAGILQERLHTRDLRRMGGLWTVMPRMGAMALFFAMASLGLPGLGNFVAEFLILLGAYRTNIPLAILATIGLVFATIYSLWLLQRAFFGPVAIEGSHPDLRPRETLVFAVMVAALLWLGLFPQPVLNAVAPALTRLPGISLHGGAYVHREPREKWGQQRISTDTFNESISVQRIAFPSDQPLWGDRKLVAVPIFPAGSHEYDLQGGAR